MNNQQHSKSVTQILKSPQKKIIRYGIAILSLVVLISISMLWNINIPQYYHTKIFIANSYHLLDVIAETNGVVYDLLPNNSRVNTGDTILQGNVCKYNSEKDIYISTSEGLLMYRDIWRKNMSYKKGDLLFSIQIDNVTDNKKPARILIDKHIYKKLKNNTSINFIINNQDQSKYLQANISSFSISNNDDIFYLYLDDIDIDSVLYSYSISEDISIDAKLIIDSKSMFENIFKWL